MLSLGSFNSFANHCSGGHKEIKDTKDTEDTSSDKSKEVKK